MPWQPRTRRARGGLACPQHPTNGYVYDGVTNRISFFGDCRPTAVGNQIDVSYKYWIDQGPLE